MNAVLRHGFGSTRPIAGRLVGLSIASTMGWPETSQLHARCPTAEQVARLQVRAGKAHGSTRQAESKWRPIPIVADIAEHVTARHAREVEVDDHHLMEVACTLRLLERGQSEFPGCLPIDITAYAHRPTCGNEVVEIRPVLFDHHQVEKACHAGIISADTLRACWGTIILRNQPELMWCGRQNADGQSIRGQKHPFLLS
jgi:hypothetical protein